MKVLPPEVCISPKKVGVEENTNKFIKQIDMQRGNQIRRTAKGPHKGPNGREWLCWCMVRAATLSLCYSFRRIAIYQDNGWACTLLQKKCTKTTVRAARQFFFLSKAQENYTLLYLKRKKEVPPTDYSPPQEDQNLTKQKTP